MAKVERDPVGETIETLGYLRKLSGVFTIADANAITERWQSGPGSGPWVIDIRGDEARYLAGRDGLPRETLCDGTERVFCTDQQQALMARDSIQQVCVSRSLSATTTIQPKGASITRARDAMREAGAGFVDDEFAAFASNGSVEVRAVRGIDGRVRELRLILA